MNGDDHAQLTYYGYEKPWEPDYDSYSAAGIGDHDNSLIPGYSAALTESERLARFGVTGHSTGQEFQFAGLTLRDDDTAPEANRRVDIYSPAGPGKLELSSGYEEADQLSQEEFEQKYLGYLPKYQEPAPEEEKAAPEDKPVIDPRANVLSGDQMVRRLREQFSAAYGYLSDDKLLSAFTQKYDTPLKQLRALYPEYKKMSDADFAAAVREKFYPQDTDEEFHDRMNPPSGITGVYKHFTEQWPNLMKGWYNSTAEVAKFPDRAINLLDRVVDSLGMRDPRMEELGDPNQNAQIVGPLYEWAKRQAARGEKWQRQHQKLFPQPQGYAGAIGQKFFEGIGSAPEVAASFLPGLPPAQALIAGITYDGIQAEARSRESGMDTGLAQGVRAVTTRSIAQMLLSTPRGRLLSGVAWAALGIGDKQAQNFLEGKPNDLHELAGIAATNGLFGAIFSAGPEKLPEPAKEIFFDAIESRKKGDYKQAAALIDKAMALTPENMRLTIGNNLLTWKDEAIPANNGEQPLALPGRREFKALPAPEPTPEVGAEAITTAKQLTIAKKAKAIEKPETAVDTVTDQFYYAGLPMPRLDIVLPRMRAGVKKALHGRGLIDPQFWQDIWAPEYGSIPRETAKSIIGQEIGKKQTDQHRIMDVWMRQQNLERNLRFAYEADQRRAYWLNFPKAQLMQIAEEWEAGSTPHNKVAARLVELYKGINRAIARMDEKNGLRYNVRDSYLYHALSDPKDIDRVEETIRRMKWGDPAFMKPRQIPNVTMLHALGFRLKTYNFEDLMQMRLDSSLHARMVADILDSLNAAKLAIRSDQMKLLSKDVQNEIRAQSAAQVWRSPRHPGLSFYVHKEADFMLHRAVDPLGKLQVWLAPMQAIKQRTVGLNLGLSGYHHLHMLPIGAADSVSLALQRWIDGTGSIADWRNALADVFTGGGFTHVKSLNYNQALLNWYAGKLTKAQLSPFELESLELQRAGGFTPHLSQEREIQFMRRILGSITPAARHADKAIDLGYNILSGRPYQKWLFSRAIPSLKMYSYDRYARQLLEAHPEFARPSFRVERDRELHKIRDQVDARFGEQNLEQSFTHKWVKGIGQAVMLSYSWTKSAIEVYGGFVHDLTHIVTHMDEVARTWEQEGPRATVQKYLTQKILFGTVLTAMTAMVSGLIAHFIGDGLNSLEDLIYPSIGGTEPDGKTKKRVKPPFWLTTEIGGFAHDLEMAGGNPAMATGIWFQNKLQPALAMIMRDITNKDYRGTDISPKWDNNKGWWDNFLEQTWTKVEFDLTQMSPFSLQQSVFQAKPGTTWKDRIAAILGLPPAPKYAERTHIENRIIQTYIDYHTTKGKTREAQDQTDARANYREALKMGDTAEADKWRTELHKLGVSPQSIKNVEKNKDMTEAEGVFRLLSVPEQIGILREAQGAEREHFLHMAKPEVQQALR